MSLEAGRTLGAYEVISAIGKGGMGEVYRARDTRLDRTVAIKVLPAELADHRRGTFGGDVRAQYDVSPDGDRFVVAVPADDETSQVRIILNWHEELKRLAPID